jgi:hypothetical protein
MLVRLNHRHRHRYDLNLADPAKAADIGAEIMNELRTNADIAKGHPHIVQYESVIETEKYIFVLMELVGKSSTTRGVDLFDFICAERDGAWVSEDEAR